MVSFAQLVGVLASNQIGAPSEDVIGALARLFSESTPAEAQAIAYLATGRLGAPHAPRQPWMGVTSSDLVERFRNTRDAGSSPSDDVTVLDAYDVLHAMDPVRPDWFPDGTENTARLLLLVASLSQSAFKWFMNVMLGWELLSDPMITRALVEALCEPSERQSVNRELLKRLRTCTPDIGLVAHVLLSTGVVAALSELSKSHYGVPVPLEIMNTHSRQDIMGALKRIRSQSVYVQAKSDGVYVQVHKDGDSVCLFDESGVDIARLARPGIVRSGPKRRTDTQRCRAAARADALAALIMQVPAPRMILDTEIIGINASRNGVVERSETFTAHQLQILVFDIIATDQDHRWLGYSERRRIMRRLLGEKPPGFQAGVYVAEEVLARGPEDVSRHFDEFLQKNRYEGVVLKNPTSYLSRNLRRTQKRIKMKQYTSLDMVVVGFYLGRDQVQPTTYLVALRDTSTDKYCPCAVVVAHRSHQEAISQYCLATSTSKCPPDVVPDGAPSRWTDATLVVEVESDGLRVENRDPRFAHFRWSLHQTPLRNIVGIRDDKSRDRTNTLARLLELRLAPGSGL